MFPSIIHPQSGVFLPRVRIRRFHIMASSWQSLIGTVVNLAGLLPGFSGLLGWKSWGWALSWLAHTLFVNNSFFSDFGFHNFNGDFGESSLWVHNAAHRSGVPYASSLVASLYGGGGLPARITNHFGQGVSEWQGFRSGAKVNSGYTTWTAFCALRIKRQRKFPAGQSDGKMGQLAGSQQRDADGNCRTIWAGVFATDLGDEWRSSAKSQCR